MNEHKVLHFYLTAAMLLQNALQVNSTGALSIQNTSDK